MQYPIRVLSDLHLGHPACLIQDVEQLRPLIAGAGTMIFNGDSWQELSKAMRHESGTLLQQLKTLCTAEGAEAIFLPGNHDPSISSRNAVELDEGRIVIFHGHIIYPEVSPWSNYYFAKQAEVTELLAERYNESLTVDERSELAAEVVRVMTPKGWIPQKSKLHYYLNTLWPPQRFFSLLGVMKNAPQHGVDFCKQLFPKAEIAIIGHFHQSIIYQRDQFTLYNTGAFMSGCQYQCVEIMEKTVNALNVGKSKDGEFFMQR